MDYTVKLVVGVKNGYTYYDHAITPIEETKLLRSIDEIKRPFASKEHVRLSTNGAQEASTYERYLTVCRAIARGHRRDTGGASVSTRCLKYRFSMHKHEFTG